LAQVLQTVLLSELPLLSTDGTANLSINDEGTRESLKELISELLPYEHKKNQGVRFSLNDLEDLYTFHLGLYGEVDIYGIADMITRILSLDSYREERKKLREDFEAGLWSNDDRKSVYKTQRPKEPGSSSELDEIPF
jgi:hypothetical protein